jgi:hypothetical protein
MSPTSGRIEDLVMRVQDDFLETPRMALTLPAAQQLFCVDEVTCEAVLAALVEANVLTKTREGVYIRHFRHAA